MAKVIQTCYTCGSAWDLEEADVCRRCVPTAHPPSYLKNPLSTISRTAVLVSECPAEPDPNIDPYDISFRP